MSQAVARDPIREFVQSAAVHIRKTELFYGWMILLSTLLFSTLLFVLVDHWVWEFNRPIRILLWISLLLWSIWWFIRRILPPMRYRIHPEYAARQFELQDPRSKDSLISWIQLNQSTSTAPKSVLNFVGRYAFGFLRNSDAAQVADTANLVRLSAAFFGCLLCTMIYFFASPKSGFTSAARMLIPWANIAPATRVQFAQITPGSNTIMQGSSIPIDVTVKGLHKNEKVFLRYDLSDGQVRGKTVEMNEEIQGINYKLDFGKESGGLHQPLTYWIHAGDAVAGPFDVRIQIVPLVAIDHIDLAFPPYTNLKPRSIQQQGHFEAPEGTVAHIHAVANQEMQSARVEFDPVMQNKLFISAREFLDMKVDKTQLEATWTATYDRKNPSERKSLTYRIHAVNQLKESNHDPVIYQIKVIPDLPPEIEFVGNASTSVEVPLDQGLFLELTARDPDYGLTAIAIQGMAENKLNPQDPKVLFKAALFNSENENPRTRGAQYTFIPSDHQLKIGDEIDLVAVAADNYHNPASQKLDPQTGYSRPLRIRIVEPDAKTENEKDPKNLEPAAQDPAIADSETNQNKSRIDWNKFRNKNQQNPGNSKSSNSEPSQPDPQSSTDANSPKNGQGGGQGGTERSGSSQSDPNGQNSPANPTPSGDNNPSLPNLDPNSNPSNGTSGSQSGEPNDSIGESRTQDQKAFEKIQQFMKERQQDGSQSRNPSAGGAGAEQFKSEPQSNDKPGMDESGSDKAGSDKAGSDKAGSDKAGNDKAGNDKAGSDKSGSDKTGSDKTGNDKAGSDKSGSDKSGSDKSGSDKAGSDKAGNDKAGSDKAGSDKAGSDKAGSDKAGSDKAGSDKAGSDKAGNDKTGNDKTGNDKTGNDKAGNDKAGSDKAGSDKAGSDKAGSDKAGSDKAGSDKTGSDKAGSDKAGSDKAGSDKAGSDKTGSDKSGSDKSGAEDFGKQGMKDEAKKSNQNPLESPEQKGPKAVPNQEQGDGQGSGGEEGGKQSKQNSSVPNAAGSGLNQTGRTPESGGSVVGGRPSQSSEFGADRSNEEYSRKAADMLLEYIDRQKDQPDPDLLKRLNWNSEDFRKFADRWRNAKEQAEFDPNKRAELEETLRNLGLSGTGQKVNKLKDRNDTLRGMQEQGGRLRPPESLREQFEAFRKAAGKLGK